MVSISGKVSHVIQKYIAFAGMGLPSSSLVSEYEFIIIIEGDEKRGAGKEIHGTLFVARIIIILAASFKRWGKKEFSASSDVFPVIMQNGFQILLCTFHV